MLLSMPAATALIALAVPIVRVLFERGAFGEVATVETASALIGFAAGLPAFVLIRVLQPGFFARQDTATPTIFAGISAIANVVISVALFPTLQHTGIAIATSVSAWLNAILLGYFLHRRAHFSLTATLWRQHGLLIAISIAMALLLIGLAWPLGSVFAAGASLLLQLVALAALIGFGIIFYFAAVHFSGVQPMGMLLKRLRRGG
jgi:putative peptidoglycan lipid II flippase